MKEKIAAFIEKRGYSYRAIFIAIAAFPPAALFIIWKKPDCNLTIRIGLTLVSFIPPIVFLWGGSLLVHLI